MAFSHSSFRPGGLVNPDFVVDLIFTPTDSEDSGDSSDDDHEKCLEKDFENDVLGKIKEGVADLPTCILTKNDNVAPVDSLPQTREIEIGPPSFEIKHTQETAMSFFSRVSLARLPSV
jgi:hypothetical protein